MKEMTRLELAVFKILNEADIPFTREYRAVPPRLFRWDFALGTDPEQTRLLIEAQGATWVKGGHSTGGGIARDAEKLNLATIKGWRVLFFTDNMLRDKAKVLETIQAALQARSPRE